VVDGRIQLPVELDVGQHRAQRVAPEVGEGGADAGGGQGEPVAQQRGEPELRQVARRPEVCEAVFA
jgi:hypothetical protein